MNLLQQIQQVHKTQADQTFYFVQQTNINELHLDYNKKAKVQQKIKMKKTKQQGKNQLNKKYLPQKLSTEKQQISLLLQQQSNIEFRHGRIKYFNDTSVFKIKNQQFKDALLFLKQAEKLLESQQSDNQFDIITHSNCVIQNYACVYYKQFQLQKSQQYMNMILQNLQNFIQNSQKVPKKPNILYLSTQSQKKSLKITIINRFVLLSYYFQSTTITTQLGKHEYAVILMEKCLDVIKKICQNLMQMQICEYGLKSIKSDPERRQGMDMLTCLVQEDISNDMDSRQFDIAVVIDILKEIKLTSQQQQTQDQGNIIDSMNILGRKTLSPTTVEEYTQKVTRYSKQILNPNIKIQLTLYMSLCYFTLATLNRLIAGQKYNQYKKQSPLYKYSRQIHLRCIFVYVRYIKNWSKYLQFIVNSFNSNYGIDLINSDFPYNLQPGEQQQFNKIKDISQIPVYSQKNDMIMSVQKQKSCVAIDINEIKHIHSKVSYQQTQIKKQIKIFENPKLKTQLTKQINTNTQKNSNYDIVESKKLDFNEVIGLGINLDLGIYRNVIIPQNKREENKYQQRYKNYLTIRHLKQKKQGKVQMKLSIGKNVKSSKNLQMHSQNQKFTMHKSPSSNNSHQHKLKSKSKGIQNSKRLKSSKNIYSSTPILKNGNSKSSRQQACKIKSKDQQERKNNIQSVRYISQYEINNTRRQNINNKINNNKNKILDTNINSSPNKLVKKQKTKLRKTVGEIPQNEGEYINEYNIQKQKLMKNIKSKTINHHGSSNQLLNLRYKTDISNQKNNGDGTKRNMQMQINQQYNFLQNQKFKQKQKQKSIPKIKSNSQRCINFNSTNISTKDNKPRSICNLYANARLNKNPRQQKIQFQRKRQNKNYHDLIPSSSNKINNRHKTDFSSSIEINNFLDNENQYKKANDYNLGANKKSKKDPQLQGYLLSSSQSQPSINQHFQAYPKKINHNSSDNELYDNSPKQKTKGKKTQMLQSKKYKKQLDEKKQKNKKEYKKQSKDTISSKQMQKNQKIRKSIGFNQANSSKKQKNKKKK